MSDRTKHIPLSEFVQHLRDNPTPEEAMIRPELEARGFIFQCQIDPYVVDFHSDKYPISIEIDGYAHEPKDAQQRDRVREVACGGVFLRFSNDLVRNQMPQCLDMVDKFIAFWESTKAVTGASVFVANVWLARMGDLSLSVKQARRAQKLFDMEESKVQAAARKARKA